MRPDDTDQPGGLEDDALPSPDELAAMTASDLFVLAHEQTLDNVEIEDLQGEIALLEARMRANQERHDVVWEAAMEVREQRRGMGGESRAER